MASQLTRDDAARIAGLAQLDLTPAELDTFASQLTDILAYAAIVQEAEVADPRTPNPEPRTPNPEPLNPGTPEPRNPGTPLRPRSDRPEPSLDRDVVLAESPDGVSASGFFRVPRVR